MKVNKNSNMRFIGLSVSNERVKVLKKKDFDVFDLWLYEDSEYIFVVDNYTNESVIFDIYKNKNNKKSKDKYVEGLILDVDIFLLLLEMIELKLVKSINTNNKGRYVYLTVDDYIIKGGYIRIYQLVIFYDIILRKVLSKKFGSLNISFPLQKIIDNKSRIIHHNEPLKDGSGLFSTMDNRKCSLYFIDYQIHSKIHGSYKKYFKSYDNKILDKIIYQLENNEKYFREELNLISREEFLENYYEYEDLIFI